VAAANLLGLACTPTPAATPLASANTSTSNAQPAAPPSTTSAPVAAEKCTGSAPKELRRELTRRAGNVRGCYLQLLHAQIDDGKPLSEGRFVIAVRISLEGDVLTATMAEAPFGNENFSECLLSTFRPRLDTTPEGGCIDVMIPISFKPKNGPSSMPATQPVDGPPP
jgi:hypothetical protein